MKKAKLLVLLFALVFMISVILCFEKLFFVKEENIYVRLYPNQVLLSCLDCEKLILNYKDDFENIVEIVNLYLLDHRNFHASFDENGELNIDDALLENEILISALCGIHADDSLSNNPFAIIAGRQMDGTVFIRMQLYSGKSTYSGIEYRERGVYLYPDSYEEQINEHWFWYSYPIH